MNTTEQCNRKISRRLFAGSVFRANLGWPPDFSGERNFHIFYYLYDSLQAEGRLQEFRLDPHGRHSHRYISNNVSDNRAAAVRSPSLRQKRQ